MWHQKPAREVLDIPDFTLPKRLTRLGIANRIVYDSDKWEDDGDFHLYQHEFVSKPEVFVADRYGEIDTRDFLDIDSLDGFELNWIVLAFVRELRVRIPEQRRKTNFVYGEPPIMACNPELDTVVVLHSELTFIRGGTMQITERGIVR